jgi:hypothetical protein
MLNYHSTLPTFTGYICSPSKNAVRRSEGKCLSQDGQQISFGGLAQDIRVSQAGMDTVQSIDLDALTAA